MTIDATVTNTPAPASALQLLLGGGDAASDRLTTSDRAIQYAMHINNSVMALDRVRELAGYLALRPEALMQLPSRTVDNSYNAAAVLARWRKRNSTPTTTRHRLAATR